MRDLSLLTSRVLAALHRAGAIADHELAAECARRVVHQLELRTRHRAPRLDVAPLGHTVRA